LNDIEEMSWKSRDRSVELIQIRRSSRCSVTSEPQSDRICSSITAAVCLMSVKTKLLLQLTALCVLQYVMVAGRGLQYDAVVTSVTLLPLL